MPTSSDDQSPAIGVVPSAWYSVAVDPGVLGVAPSSNAWDATHAAVEHQVEVAGGHRVLMAEPDIEQDAYPTRPDLTGRSTAETDGPKPQRGPPFAPDGEFAWHLNDEHSGLRRARDSLGVQNSHITIVHLDTGFDRSHAARPMNVVQEHNLIDGEDATKANDSTPAGGFNNPGHGTGTLGILAGRLLRGVRPTCAEGVVLGAAAPMRIIPVRIANSVIKFWTRTVAEGIAYATTVGADVVSMSMGGLPSSAWADAVNLAYDAGIVVVCASGNNEYRGFPTSLTVWPARFNRVIAAYGFMADFQPYAGLNTDEMQGNAGPASKTRTTVTAPTPNIPWARCGKPDLIDLDGAGTSSATPQIAAAAALWLHAHHSAFPKGSWRRAEAARQALLRNAFLPTGPNVLLGSGCLRAYDALKAQVPGDLRREAQDDAAFAFVRAITGIFGAVEANGPGAAMLALEMTQLAMMSRAATDAVPDPGSPDLTVSDAQAKKFIQAIRSAPGCSLTLARFLDQAH